jgi:hypothetical protein
MAEFSVQASSSEALHGKLLDIMLPPPGQKTKTLLAVANTLIEYCKTKSEDRSPIADKIDQQVTRLLQMLEQEH